MDVAEMVN